jgi:Salmonella virulence plasmid 28.
MDDNPSTENNAKSLLDTLIEAYAPEGKAAEFEKLVKEKLRLTSVFDITGMTEADFKDRLATEINNDNAHAGSIDAKSLYNDARCYAAQISHLYREQRTSDGTAQHQWHPLGIRAVEKQGPTYTHLFKENWDDACKNDSIAAIDSPVAYLRALYRFALELESSTSQISDEKTNRIPLAKRRPDLADLSIDQQSTFTAQPMLGIVNAILDKNIQNALQTTDDKGKSTYEVLAHRYYPFALPYEFFHHQCLLGLSANKPTLGELNYLISDSLPLTPSRSSSYGKVLETASDEAQMLMSGLGPKQQALLTAWAEKTLTHEVHTQLPPEEQSERKGNYWEKIYGSASISDLKKIPTFLELTELKAEQMEALLAQGKFAPRTSPHYSLEVPFSRPYGARYVNGPVVADDKSMTLDNENKPGEIANATEDKLERLHRMIRLQRWLAIPFNELDILICSALESQLRVNAKMQLDSYVIRALGVYLFLNRRYSITAEDFAALLHQISPCAIGDNISLFDKVFNKARLFEKPLKLDGRAFQANDSDPVSHTILQHLSVSLGLPLTEDSLLLVVKNTQKYLGPLKCDLPTLSSIYRQARIARMFGLSIAELSTLASLLGGESMSRCLATGNTLSGEIDEVVLSAPPQEASAHILDILMQLDWITRWIKESAYDIPMLQRLLERHPNDDYLLVDLQHHLTKLVADTRQCAVTAQELATLALPEKFDWGAKLADTLLDDKGLVKNFAPSIKDDVPQKLTDALDKIFVELALDADPDKDLRLKTDCKQKLKNLLLLAHDRQQHLIEAFLQETFLLPMNCASDVVVWAKTSVHQILTATLDSKNSYELARTLHPLLRHTEAAVRLQLSNKALRAFLNTPRWLDTPDGQLRLSFKTLYLFDRFNHFMNTYQQPEESLLSYLEFANFFGREPSVVNLRLAQLMKWTTAEVTVFTSKLMFKQATTMRDIDWVMRCHNACKATGLNATALLNAASLDNNSPVAQWKTVGEAVMAASH